jgi:hypothetical protein
VLTLSAANGTFKIPPGDPNYRVDADFEVPREVRLVALHPHMHTRGKDFEYRLVFPTGETQTLLKVPAYNWHCGCTSIRSGRPHCSAAHRPDRKQYLS